MKDVILEKLLTANATVYTEEAEGWISAVHPEITNVYFVERMKSLFVYASIAQDHQGKIGDIFDEKRKQYKKELKETETTAYRDKAVNDGSNGGTGGAGSDANSSGSISVGSIGRA